MNMIKLVTCKLLFAAAAALLVPNLALAQTSTGADDKMNTGASCEALASGYPVDFYYRPTSIQNISTGFRYIACPVLIDSEELWDLADNNGGVDNGNAILRLVFDYSQAAANTVTCTAQVMGSGAAFLQTASSSVAGAAGDPDVFLTISGLLQGDADTNALAFNCNLPPKVMLKTINIEEYAVTHNAQVP